MTIVQEPAVVPAAAITHKFVDIARGMRADLLARSAQTELDRSVSPEVVETLKAHGFFEYLVPQKWGGHGGTLTGQIEIAAELAKGCPSTAWIFTLISWVNGFIGAYLPEEGTRAIHEATDGHVMGAGANGLTGTARPSGDGYVISGSWGYCSGINHANWLMGGVLIKDDATGAVIPGWAYMPMSDITVKDTWNVSGLRGTGSNTAFADNVYVPKSQVMLLPDRLASEANPNPADDPVYRVPFAAMFGLALMGTCLGAADAAAEYISEKAPQRGITYFEFDKQTDSGALLEKLGEAKMKIETAWLHVRRGATLLDDTTVHGEVSYRDRARCRADAVHAAESVRSAMDMLLNIGSSSSFAESNPLQRYWRDINVGSRHAFLNSAPVYEAYSRADLGIEPNVTVYI